MGEDGMLKNRDTGDCLPHPRVNKVQQDRLEEKRSPDRPIVVQLRNTDFTDLADFTDFISPLPSKAAHLGCACYKENLCNP